MRLFRGVKFNAPKKGTFFGSPLGSKDFVNFSSKKLSRILKPLGSGLKKLPSIEKKYKLKVKKI